MMVKPNRYLQLAVQAEIGGGRASLGFGYLSPRDDETLGFWRFSGGLILTVNAPPAEFRGGALFAGVGPMVHHLRFAEHSETIVGLRAVVGYCFFEGVVQIDAFGAVDLVRDERQTRSYNPLDLGLDNPGIQLDFIVYYDVR